MKYSTTFLLAIFFLFQISSFAQNQTMGLFFNTPESFNGYTLFSNNEFSYLIDNCGFKVNKWESEYKAGHGIYLMENGDLLRQGSFPGDFDAGGRGGVFELYDWNGNLKWKYEIANNQQHAHHDIAVLPNGNFLCTIWEKKSEAEAINNGRKYNGEVWSASILEIEILPNNQANIVWKWSVWDHLIQDFDASKLNFGTVANHPELIDLNYIGEGEENFGNWLHLNAISYNEEFDQIAISSRNLSEIYIIDHSTTIAEAATQSGGNSGKGGSILFRYGNPQVYDHGDESDQVLWRQHDINWTPNGSEWSGSFSIFNNKPQENQSSALLFNNPADENGNYNFEPPMGYGDVSIVREFTTLGFYSDILSGVQVLDNNNLLLLEGRSGHLTEIDQNDNVVWEYINPVNRNGGPGIQTGTLQFNLLFRAIRYAPTFIGFEGMNLAPTTPVELLPLPSDCEISETTVNTEELIKSTAKNIKIHGNIIHSRMVVENFTNSNLEVKIYTVSGIENGILLLSSGINEFNIELPQGMYFLNIKNKTLKLI